MARPVTKIEPGTEATTATRTGVRPFQFVHVAAAGVATLAAVFSVAWSVLWSGAAPAHATVLGQTQGSVATVDLERLIAELDEFDDRDAELQARVQQRNSELQAIAASIESLRADRELLPATDDSGRRDIEARLYEKQREIASKREVFQTLGDLELGDILRDLYPKVLAGIDQVAGEGGFQVVLSDLSEPQLRAQNGTQALQELSSQVILYTADGIDITDSVINRLNSQYAAGP